MTPVKFIYFDLGNVLCFFSHELAAQQVADLAGLDPVGVRQLMFESDFALEYETGQITTSGFHDVFCKTALLPLVAASISANW